MYQSKIDNWHIRIRCHYYFSVECNWYCGPIRNKENIVYFCIGNCKHSNHYKANKKVGALTQAMVLIKNPGSFNQSPAQFIHSVRKTRLTVGPKQENSIKIKISRLRTQHKTGHMKKGTLVTSFAAVHINIEILRKEILKISIPIWFI